MKKNLVIKGGSILVNNTWLENGSLSIQKGYIQAVYELGNETPISDSDVFDAKGMYIIPGLIDSHTYGARGHDTHAGGLNALLKLRQIYPKYGVTAFLPSVPSCSCNEIERVASACKSAMSVTNPGATVLGLFSEGICVNPRKRGAQVQNSEICTIERFVEILYSFPNIFQIITLAPEIKKCSPIFHACLDLGVIPSFGHSSATYQQVSEAFDIGYSHVTHLYNAMGELLEEKSDGSVLSGPITAALVDDRVYTEIIADGYHVHPAAVKIVIKAKHPEKMILVTDSMHAAGTGFIGKMSFAGQEVEVTEDVALLDTGRPAASILTLDKAIRNIVMWNAATLEGAINMATKNPATLLSLKNRGQIAPGYRADIVVLNKDLNVVATWCDGVLIYQA